jgi:TetR/AcrR family transcriptional regulator
MQRALRQQQQRRHGRERGAEATRQAFLDAAEIIFARDGFSGARVDDIAHTAGHNKALIFHYFEDKLGLYRALMSRTKQHIFARFETAFDHFLAPHEAITAERVHGLAAECLRVIFAYYREHPQTASILAWEAAEGWQTFASCEPAVTGSWPARALTLIQRAQREGIVRGDLDPHVLLTTLMSLPLIHMISLPRFALMFPERDFTSPEAIAHACDQITALVLRGIMTSPQEA